MRRTNALLLVILATSLSPLATPPMPASAATPTWTRTFGTSLTDDAWAAAAAPDGGVVVASLERTGDPFEPRLDRSVLRRFRPDGTVAWKRSVGTDDTLEGVASVAVTGSAVYWAGDVHRDPPDDDRPYFVRKLSLDGRTIWTRWLPGLAVARTFVTVHDGDPIVAYGDGLYGDGLYVIRLDGADGSTVDGPWDTGIGAAAAGLGADSTGIYVLAAIKVFEPVVGLALLKLKHSGDQQWARIAPGSSGTSDTGLGLVMDSEGVVATYGRYRDATGHDTGVVAYTRAGSLRWRKDFSSAGWDTGAAPAVRARGPIIARTTSGSGSTLRVRELKVDGSTHATTSYAATSMLIRAVVAAKDGRLYAVGRKGSQALLMRLD